MPKLSRFRRRPSAALVIACAALFMSLGGVGYAATSLPSNSVGSNQIRSEAVTYQKIKPDAVGKVRLADGGVINSKLADGSVSYKKIQPEAVGAVRANLNQLQARVSKGCAAGSAIAAIDNKGKVSCGTTRPTPYGTTSNAAAVTGTPATISSVALPAGANYLAMANPTVTVTSGAAAQRVTASCTLTVGTSSQTRTATLVTAGTSGQTTTESIPLQLAGPAGTSSVTCSASTAGGTALPTTSATAAINALTTS